MVAYENVARSIGTTGEWLRKFVSSHGAKDPGLVTGFAIINVYRRVCERVEQATDHEKQLKDEIDALIESVGRVVVSKKNSEGK